MNFTYMHKTQYSGQNMKAHKKASRVSLKWVKSNERREKKVSANNGQVNDWTKTQHTQHIFLSVKFKQP